jgi:hypothetical protein
MFDTVGELFERYIRAFKTDQITGSQTVISMFCKNRRATESDLPVYIDDDDQVLVGRTRAETVIIGITSRVHNEHPLFAVGIFVAVFMTLE